MFSAPVVECDLDTPDMIDPVWEMRLRTWARRHYVSAYDRDLNWHPIVLDEMERIDLGN